MSLPGNTPLPSSAPPTITIRPMAPEDRGYVISTWIDEHRFSCERFSKMGAGTFRRSHVGAQIRGLMESADTRVLCGYLPNNRIAGWLAFVPGRTISTVHYAYTRRKLDEERLRRRGVMAALVDMAELGARVAYTHRGVRKKHGMGAGRFRVNDETQTLDLPLVDWMRSRGVSATFVELQEWLR